VIGRHFASPLFYDERERDGDNGHCNMLTGSAGGRGTINIKPCLVSALDHWRLITGGYRDPISDVLRNPELETACFAEENGRYPARVPVSFQRPLIHAQVSGRGNL
jgi:hypothetical protein